MVISKFDLLKSTKHYDSLSSCLLELQHKSFRKPCNFQSLSTHKIHSSILHRTDVKLPCYNYPVIRFTFQKIAQYKLPYSLLGLWHCYYSYCKLRVQKGLLPQFLKMSNQFYLNRTIFMVNTRNLVHSSFKTFKQASFCRQLSTQILSSNTTTSTLWN